MSGPIIVENIFHRFFTETLRCAVSSVLERTEMENNIAFGNLLELIVCSTQLTAIDHRFHEILNVFYPGLGTLQPEHLQLSSLPLGVLGSRVSVYKLTKGIDYTLNADDSAITHINISNLLDFLCQKLKHFRHFGIARYGDGDSLRRWVSFVRPFLNTLCMTLDTDRLVQVRTDGISQPAKLQRTEMYYHQVEIGYENLLSQDVPELTCKILFAGKEHTMPLNVGYISQVLDEICALQETITGMLSICRGDIVSVLVTYRHDFPVFRERAFTYSLKTMFVVSFQQEIFGISVLFLEGEPGQRKICRSYNCFISHFIPHQTLSAVRKVITTNIECSSNVFSTFVLERIELRKSFNILQDTNTDMINADRESPLTNSDVPLSQLLFESSEPVFLAYAVKVPEVAALAAVATP